MGKDLSQLLTAITSPEERLPLLVEFADQGKLNDSALVTEAVTGLRASKRHGSLSQAQRIARQGGLTTLANDIFREMLESFAKSPSWASFEGWYGSTFREYAEQVGQTDLYFDTRFFNALLKKLPPSADDIALAARVGYTRTDKLQRRYLDAVERSVQASQTPHKILFAVKYDLCKTGFVDFAHQSFRRAVILAVKQGDLDAALDELRYGMWKPPSDYAFIQDKNRKHRLIGLLYTKKGDHISAARAFTAAGESDTATRHYALARADLLALRYGDGESIAEREMEDPVLAFQIAKNRAVNGGEWGVFYHYSAAAVRARQLGLADEANRLFYTGVEKGFADDSGPNGMDGGTRWYEVVNFIKSFGTPEQIIELSGRYGLHNLGAETAVALGQFERAREFAEPIFSRAAQRGTIDDSLLALAQSVGDVPRTRLYGALLAKRAV